jgi:uncharacterized membrane protein YedE/YeeE
VNPSSQQRFLVTGLQIGPIIAALLSSAGLLAFVRALQDPLTSAVIAGINYFLRRSYPNTLPLQQVYLVWQFQVAYLIIGAILLGIGLRLAFWVTSPIDSQKES